MWHVDANTVSIWSCDDWIIFNEKKTIRLLKILILHFWKNWTTRKRGKHKLMSCTEAVPHVLNRKDPMGHSLPDLRCDRAGKELIKSAVRAPSKLSTGFLIFWNVNRRIALIGLFRAFSLLLLLLLSGTFLKRTPLSLQINLVNFPLPPLLCLCVRVVFVKYLSLSTFLEIPLTYYWTFELI